jgi:hypothetical protein
MTIVELVMAPVKMTVIVEMVLYTDAIMFVVVG